jgi:predicted RNase H-like HicB family nuclease
MMARRVPGTQLHKYKGSPQVATAPKKPRYLCWRFEQVFWASNALLAHNHGINAKAVRSIFDAAHVCTEDAGSQWIGDVLGAHGLRLQKDQKQNYIPPDEGITPEYIIQYFLVPFDYQWDTDCEKYFPVVAALPPAAATTPKKTRQPRPPARPDADTALAEDVDAAWAELAETRQMLSRLGETLSSALAELQDVAQLLREALAEDPSLAGAESGLQTAAQLLAAAEGLADEMVLPAD